MSPVDLREIDADTRLRVTVGDEVFEGVVVGVDGDAASDYAKGWRSLTFEGDWWERVNDRVDSEVLTIRQDFARRSGRPKTATLTGVEWVGEVEEMSEPRYTKLGEVDSLTVLE